MTLDSINLLFGVHATADEIVRAWQRAPKAATPALVNAATSA
jgi:hypothetical protein